MGEVQVQTMSVVSFSDYRRVLITRGSPDSSASKEYACKAGDAFNSWVRQILWRRDKLPTPVFLGFPGRSEGKESSCKVWDPGLFPGWENPLKKGTAAHSSIIACRSPGQRSLAGLEPDRGLEDRGAWQATVYGVTKSQTWLSDFHVQFLSNWGKGERKKRGIPAAGGLRGNGLVMVLWLPLQESWGWNGDKRCIKAF